MIKRKLIVLSPGFPADEQDSTCLPALRMFLKEELLREHFDIRIVSMHYPFHQRNYTWFGLPVMALGGKNKKGLFRIPLYIKTWFALRKNYAKDKTTVVLSIFATEAALLASHFCKWHKLKHFCWVMGQDVKPKNPYVQMSARGTHYLAISNFSKHNFETNYMPRKCEILSNGICLSEFPNYREQPRNYDFVVVGSLISLKRVHLVLQVIKTLSDHGRKTTTLILGSGPEKDNLEQIAYNLGISESVHFNSEIPHREVIQLMMQSKILLHPSKFEGFANVWLEALYSGCHVIAYFDPFDGMESQLHKVHSYETFYKKAEQLLDEVLIHTSIQKYTTKQSAELFISYCQRTGNISKI
jgi:glycosyltransferase involved in cell wall biosynthesis